MMMDMSSDKGKMFLGGVLLYKALLDIFCWFCLTPIMAKFFLYNFNFKFCYSEYFISWTVILIIAYVWFLLVKNMPVDELNFSEWFLLFFIMLYFIPVLSFYGAGGMNDNCFLLFLVFCSILICSFFVLKCNNCINEFLVSNTYFSYIPRIREMMLLVLVCVILSNLIFIFSFYGQGDWYNFFDNGLQVYERRAVFTNYSAELPLISRYLYSFANVVEIILMIYIAKKKKWWMIFGVVLLMYMHFSIAAEKTVLFSGVLTVLLYWWRKYITPINIVFVFCIGSGVAILDVTLWLYDVSNIPWFGSLFRRVLLEPIFLNQCYYDYFLSCNTDLFDVFVIFSNRGEIANIISDIYLLSPSGSANNGMLGGAIGEFGYIGVVLVPILMSGIMYFFDIITNNLHAVDFIALLLLLSFGFVNTMITTMMITHGVLVVIFLLWCISKRGVNC